MKYFDGIEFITYGDQPDFPQVLRDREFPDYFGIQYNHAGVCRLQIDGKNELLINGGCGFFTAPGRKYTYGAQTGKRRHHSFVCFKGERVTSFIEGGLFNPFADPPIFQIQNSEKFYQNMLELQNLLRYPPGFRIARQIHLLEGLLLQISEVPNSTSGINPHLLRSINWLRKKIVEQPQKDWHFEDEAKKIAISYPHFRRLFRQATGFAPTHFLIECRLNRASRMLLESNQPINEIAHQCGYPDEFYFYRLFKQYRFCTALAYRKKFGASN